MLYMQEVERIKHIREDMIARGEPLYTCDVKDIYQAISDAYRRIERLHKGGWITSSEKAKLKARLMRIRRRTYALADIEVGW